MALLSINGDVNAHDPTIVKEKDFYYRFETGIGIPISKSADLLTWEYIENIFTKNPCWTMERVPGSTSLWAPEVVRRNGKWRVYYSVSTFGRNTSSIGLIENSTLDIRSPTYRWIDRGEIIHSVPESTYNCIDPAVCLDEEGRDWLLFGSFWRGLCLTELNEDGFIIDKNNLITIASRGNMEINPIEGGFIFYHENFFYLFASHDFCCKGSSSTYHIVVGRSKHITGPYLDMAGVDMKKGGGTRLRDGTSFARWAGPGHNSVFKDDDGQIYIVYHAYDRQNKGRPNLQIEKMYFIDGWPHFE